MKPVLFIGALVSAGMSISGVASNVASASTPEKAVLAAGCFWGTEEFFRKIPGVLDTRVGYAGGSELLKTTPSYESVSSGNTGYAESLELKFDPQKISYERLLTFFFEMHDPTTANRQGGDRGTQYRSAIFYESSEQKKIAEDVIKKIELSKAWKAALTTQVAPVGKTFYPAEEEHQKYLVKHPGGYDNHFFRNLDFGSGLPRVSEPQKK